MDTEWSRLHPHILAMEQRGLVTRTFRRLDPQRQQTILAAILDEAAAKGPADINIRQVAERAQVSVGSLYQYFGNRECLLAFAVELVTRSAIELLDAVNPYLEPLTLRDALTTYIQGGLEWSQTQPGFVQFYARAAYHGDPHLSESVVRPVATVMRQSVQGILQRAAQRGEIRPGVDLDAAGRVVYAAMIAIVDPVLLPYLNIYLQVNDASMPPERVIAAAVEMILNGIGA